MNTRGGLDGGVAGGKMTWPDATRTVGYRTCSTWLPRARATEALQQHKRDPGPSTGMVLCSSGSDSSRRFCWKDFRVLSWCATCEPPSASQNALFTVEAAAVLRVASHQRCRSLQAYRVCLATARSRGQTSLSFTCLIKREVGLAA